MQELNDYRLNIKRLNQYSSLLINSLSSIWIKSDQMNQSLNNLIYKLKVIKSCIEPIHLTLISFNTTAKLMENKLASSLANTSGYYYKINYLNSFVDLFKRTIDKNLSLFFLKQYYNCLDYDSIADESKLIRKKINIDYLNSNITILTILSNLVTFQSVDINLFDLFHGAKSSTFNTNLHLVNLNLAKYSLDLNENFNSKRYLGHLISRNFLSICLNLISKLTDYLKFYSKSNQLLQTTISSTFSTQTLDLEQLNLIIALTEPTIHLIRALLCKIIKIRNENFTDLTPLTILFRFNGIFSFCCQKSLNNLETKLQKTTLIKSNRLLLNDLTNRFSSINRNLTDIFMAFTQPVLTLDTRSAVKTSLFTSLYRELAKYTVEKPFNFYYGLKLFSDLLPLPLPIPIKTTEEVTNREEDIIMLNERRLLSDHLEPLLLNDTLKKKSNLFDLEQDKLAPTLINMLRTLSISSHKSNVNYYLKRICVQLCDLSDKMCSLIVKCLLDYAIELLNKVKNDNCGKNNCSNLIRSE